MPAAKRPFNSFLQQHPVGFLRRPEEFGSPTVFRFIPLPLRRIIDVQLSFLLPLETGVVSDLRHPCRQLGLEFEPFQMHIYFQVDILRDVLPVFFIADQLVDDPGHKTLGYGDQLAKRLHFAPQHLVDELSVS